MDNLKALLVANDMAVRDYSINSANPNNAKSEDYIKSDILKPRIMQSSVLLVYISPRTKDSKFVNWEIDCAQRNGKRIVGVWEHGEKGCDIPKALEDFADAVVGWQGASIIDAINEKFNGWEYPDGSKWPSKEKEIKRFSCS